MSHSPSQRDRLTFIIIGIIILVFLDRVVMHGDRPYLHPEQLYGQEQTKQQQEIAPVPEGEKVLEPQPGEESEILPDPLTPEEYRQELPEVFPEEPVEESAEQAEEILEIGFSEVEDVKMSIKTIDVIHPPIRPYVRFKEFPRISSPRVMAWRENAVSVDIPKGMPQITIIIDDMGVNEQMSEAVIGLQGPLTLAFLPYAKDVREMALEARGRGHELMVHMPMEPLNRKLDPGPDVLRAAANGAGFYEILEKNLGAIDGYVGINNHMGSKLTQDPEAMGRVMTELRSRGLLFVDSKTIHSSIAGKTAADHHIPYGVRDVFLDHHPDYKSVMKSLRRLEEIARDHGSAIGIGHPKADTIRALYEWLPTLPKKGIALAPVSAVVKAPSVAVVAVTSQVPLSPHE